MIVYRAFRNADPPRLAEIWRAAGDRRDLMQPMSAALLEQYVLAKPYFDPQGLILATVDGEPIGFVHAGFGPSEDESTLSTDWGVTCLLMVRSRESHPELPAELLARSEAYLRSRGAQVLYGGSIRPLNPFYLGLIGGSELPGVLDSDAAMQVLYRENGYREIDRTLVLRRELAGFRPPVDRRQMQIRRGTVVEVMLNPPVSNWWEACTVAFFDRMRFTLRDRSSESRLATAVFRGMEPLSTSWGVQSMGLVDLHVPPDQRRRGLATFLLGEAFRRLQSQGVTLVETQTMQRNVAAGRLYEKLGFQRIDQGAVFRKAGEDSTSSVV